MFVYSIPRLFLSTLKIAGLTRRFVRTLRWNAPRVRMLEDTMDTHFEAITWGLSELRYFGRAEGDVAQAIEEAAAAQIEGWFTWLTDQLSNQQWFNGTTFGWGDLCVVPIP